LALLGCGLDIPTAFSTIATTLYNVVPGLGDIGSNFKNLPIEALWIWNFAMIAGSLELFSLLVFFMPDFWRK
ncbi:potassium transporter, partial [Francisella tularensis subsp. holarctica]|nr:potassium transporter [Francisella tularensis subsp. holarctica]